MERIRPVRICSFAVAALVTILAGCGEVYVETVIISPHDNDPMHAHKESAVKPRYSKLGYDITPLPREDVAELAKKLTPEQYRITQKAGTERPFCGTLLDNKKEGTYCCIVCGLPLFSSEHKFDSGTGWPSFFQPVDPDHVTERQDRSHGMIRTEITCARCDAHLGHVFPDGPPPAGMRHCLNSEALVFYAKDAEVPPASRPIDTAVAYFAGGCFWGIEHYFRQGPGVIDAISGYMQGHVDNPSYKEVCTGRTGHAEAVKVIYDPNRISYRRLLRAFFDMHDPTQINRQGPDVGTQYRSGIYFTNDDQRRDAEAVIAELSGGNAFGGRKFVTEVEEAKAFWPAEDHHQRYIERTGRACHVANPWRD